MNKRKPLKFSLSLVVIGLLALAISACSTTLVLPQKNASMEQVYLIKYATWGHHSLAFYRDGKITEFTYGDWELFALNQRDGWTAWKNMTFSTQGALGKKVTQWDLNEPLCDKFKDCELVAPFLAPTQKVLELREELESMYTQNIQSEVFNDKEGVHFVKYPIPYWGFHNCNHELVSWLEKLGAEVSGKIFYQPDFIGGMVAHESK
jgi:hypothetical protein